MATRVEQYKANWAYRRAVCEKFNASGLRAEDFCEQEGLSYYAFCKWRSRIKQIDKESLGDGADPVISNPENIFVEVSRKSREVTPCTQSTITNSTSAEITFPNQIRVELRCESRNLKELMEVLFRC